MRRGLGVVLGAWICLWGGLVAECIRVAGFDGLNEGSGEGTRGEGTFNADLVAWVDFGEGDGVTAFAEGCVFIDQKAVGSVVGDAFEGDFGFVDGGNAAGEPGFAELGLILAHLAGALGVHLKNHDCSEGPFG